MRKFYKAILRGRVAVKNAIKNPNANQQQSHIPSHNFDVAKLVSSPPPDTPNHEEHVDFTTGLSLKKFLSFGCFDLRYVVFWG